MLIRNSTTRWITRSTAGGDLENADPEITPARPLEAEVGELLEVELELGSADCVGVVVRWRPGQLGNGRLEAVQTVGIGGARTRG